MNVTLFNFNDKIDSTLLFLSQLAVLISLKRKFLDPANSLIHLILFSMTAPSKNVRKEMNDLFINNEIDDLKRMLNKRQRLNLSNMVFLYTFHIMQALGLFITAMAASFDYKGLIWVGIGCNVIAQLLNRFENINNAISDRLLQDVTTMKENQYIDEGLLVDPEKDNKGVFNSEVRLPLLSKTDDKVVLN